MLRQENVSVLFSWLPPLSDLFLPQPDHGRPACSGKTNRGSPKVQYFGEEPNRFLSEFNYSGDMTDRSLTASVKSRFPADRMIPVRLDFRLLAAVFSGLTAWLLLAMILKNLIYSAEGSAASATPAYYRYAVRNTTLFFEGVMLIGLLRLLPQIRNAELKVVARRIWSRNRDALTAAPFMCLAGVFSFGLLMSSYSTVKARIPSIIPFAWDDTFAAWDASLAFGTDPWKLFEWVYEIPPILITLDFLYDIWAALLVGSWVTCFVASGIEPARRLRYCLSLMMTWFIGGNLLALVFSSAGPCFYEHVGTDPARYADLMTHLHSLPALRNTGMQDMLWDTFKQDGIGIGGISAFPSMHCATAFLFALMFGRTPVWRTITTAYFVVVLLGSFILGWHYMVDGLAGAAVAFACWKLGGIVAARVYPPAAK
ncbi:phosphatase PAP2 family protein [Hyphomonas adhaerens]|uniref:phosphatase PAP2 family protein n=1 Tax=Hyphomonas adhaerens TaxID=81029 RepID=UPI002352FAE1|nr:phosphatase PAP2 family protein [Hyphomonas adhaerens]